jgi:trans-aconitate 2-methyltransferase
MRMYEWNAVDYARSSGIQQKWARELIRKLGLIGNERLLDIGSGDGKVTAEIASLLLDGFVVGIDNSEDMIKLSQGTYSADVDANLRFQLEDACSLPFENEFDIVFSNAALHWVSDHRPVLCGIYKSLKHGGKILLQMGGRGNAGEVMNALDRLLNREEWAEYFRGFNFSYGFYSPDEYSVWLLESGLNVKRAELIPKIAAHQGLEGFKSWIRTTWLPYTHQLPDEKREPFISQLADEYIKRHPADEDNIVRVNMVRLEIEAQKM